MPSDVCMHTWTAAVPFLIPALLGSWEERVGVFGWGGHKEKVRSLFRKKYRMKRKLIPALSRKQRSMRKSVLGQCQTKVDMRENVQILILGQITRDHETLLLV